MSQSKHIDTTIKPHTNLRLRTKENYSVVYERHTPNLPTVETTTIQSDQSFKRYLDYLKIRGNNKGRISHATLSHVTRAVKHFLEYCNLEITNHALNDLVEYKRNNPQSSDIEEALRAFATTEPIHARTADTSAILGIFNRGNFTQLHLHVNNHFYPERQEIPEETLKEIFKGTTEEMQTLQLFQTYIGERIFAVAHVKDKDINLDLDEELAIIFFDGSTTKNHIKHFSLCPKNVATKVLEIMNKTGRQTAFPNHTTIWKQITKFAKDEFKIKYTSHYLRARFETIADDTGISMNKVNFLMGGAPHGTDDTAKLGHLPQIYIMKQIPKMATPYKQYLQNKLDLTQ